MAPVDGRRPSVPLSFRTAERPMRIKIERKRPWKGFPAVPEHDPSRGYEMGPPAAGREKHHRANAVWVETLEDVVAHLRLGYSLRMTNAGRMRGSLICPDSLIVRRI